MLVGIVTDSEKLGSPVGMPMVGETLRLGSVRERSLASRLASVGSGRGKPVSVVLESVRVKSGLCFLASVGKGRGKPVRVVLDRVRVKSSFRGTWSSLAPVGSGMFVMVKLDKREVGKTIGTAATCWATRAARRARV